MQQLKKEGSAATWAIVVVLALAFGALEAYGIWRCDRGLATNRAWFGPCVWGWLLCLIALMMFIANLVLARLGKAGARAILPLIVIGVSPTLVLCVMTAVRWIIPH